MIKKEWTPELIRILTGLEPYKEYNENHLKSSKGYLSEEHFLQESKRQTGRTTKLCCEAIAKVKNGEKVLILCGYQATQNVIKKMIFDLLDKAGLSINEDLIKYQIIEPVQGSVLIDNTVSFE